MYAAVVLNLGWVHLEHMGPLSPVVNGTTDQGNHGLGKTYLGIVFMKL